MHSDSVKVVLAQLDFVKSVRDGYGRHVRSPGVGVTRRAVAFLSAAMDKEDWWTAMAANLAGYQSVSAT